MKALSGRARRALESFGTGFPDDILRQRIIAAHEQGCLLVAKGIGPSVYEEVLQWAYGSRTPPAAVGMDEMLREERNASLARAAARAIQAPEFAPPRSMTDTRRWSITR